MTEGSYEGWLEEEVAVGPKFAVTRREYYQRYFDPGTDPRRIFEQDMRVLGELRALGAISEGAATTVERPTQS